MSDNIIEMFRQSFAFMAGTSDFQALSSDDLNRLAGSPYGLLNLVTATEMSAWVAGHSLAGLTWQALNALSNISICADDTKNPPNGTALAGSGDYFAEWVKIHRTDFQFLDAATLRQLASTGSPILFSWVNADLFSLWLSVSGHHFFDLTVAVVDALGKSGRLPLHAVSAVQWRDWALHNHRNIVSLSASVFGQIGAPVLNDLVSSLAPVSSQAFYTWLVYNGATGFVQLSAPVLKALSGDFRPLLGQENLTPAIWVQWANQHSLAGLDPSVFAQISGQAINALADAGLLSLNQEQFRAWFQQQGSQVSVLSVATINSLAPGLLRLMTLSQVTNWIEAHPTAVTPPSLSGTLQGDTMANPVAVPLDPATPLPIPLPILLPNPVPVPFVLSSDAITAFAGIWVQAMAAAQAWSQPSAQQVHAVPDVIAVAGAAALIQTGAPAVDPLFAACYSTNDAAALDALRQLSDVLSAGPLVAIETYRSAAQVLDIWAKTGPASAWTIDALLAFAVVNQAIAGPPRSFPAGGVSVADVNLAHLWSRGQFTLMLELGLVGDLQAPTINGLTAHNPGVLNLFGAQTLTVWLAHNSLASLSSDTLNAFSDTAAGAGTANPPVGTALAGLSADGNTNLVSWMAAHPDQFRFLDVNTLEALAGGPNGISQFITVTGTDLQHWAAHFANRFKDLTAPVIIDLAAGTGHPLSMVAAQDWLQWVGRTGNSLGQLTPSAFSQISFSALRLLAQDNPDSLSLATPAFWADWAGQPDNSLASLSVQVLWLMSAGALNAIATQHQDALAALSSLDLQSWQSNPSHLFSGLSVSLLNGLTNPLVVNFLRGIPPLSWRDWAAGHDQSMAGLQGTVVREFTSDTLDSLSILDPQFLRSMARGQFEAWLGNVSNHFLSLSVSVLDNLTGGGDPLKSDSLTGVMWNQWAAAHEDSDLPNSIIVQVSPQAMAQMAVMVGGSAFLQKMTAAQFAAWSAPSAGNIQQLSVADMQALAASWPSLVQALSLDSVNAWIAARSTAEPTALNHLNSDVLNEFSAIWVSAMEADSGASAKSQPFGTATVPVLTMDQITPIPGILAGSPDLSSLADNGLFAAGYALSPENGTEARKLLIQALKLHQIANVNRYLTIARALNVFAEPLIGLSSLPTWIPATIITLEVLNQNSGPQADSGGWPAGGVFYDDVRLARLWSRGQFSQELQTGYFARNSAGFLNDLAAQSPCGVLNLVRAGDFYNWLSDNHNKLSSLTWQALNALSDISVGAGTANPPDGTALAALGIRRNNFASWMADHRADFRELDFATLEALAAGPAGAAQFAGITAADMLSWLGSHNGQVAPLTATLVNALAAGQGLQALTPDQWIDWLSKRGRSLSDLSVQAFAQLGADSLIRIASGHPQWLGAVTQTQFAAWLAADAGRLSGLTMAVITDLAGAGQALQAMSADDWRQVAATNNNRLVGLPYQVIAEMSAASLNNLASASPTPLAGMNRDQFNAWLSNQANQFQDLSAAALDALTDPSQPLQASNLTAALWAAWAARPGHALAQLQPAFFSAPTADQLNADADQFPVLLGGLTADQFNSLPLGQLQKSVINALGTYDPDLLTGLSVTSFGSWLTTHSLDSLSAAALSALAAGPVGVGVIALMTVDQMNAWLSVNPVDFANLSAVTLNLLAGAFGGDSQLTAVQLRAWFAAHPDPGAVALQPMLLDGLAASPAAAGLAAMSAYQMDAILALPAGQTAPGLTAQALSAIGGGQALAEVSVQQFEALPNAVFLSLTAAALGGLSAELRAQITAAQWLDWAQAAPDHRLANLGPAALTGWSADSLNRLAAMSIDAQTGTSLLAGVTAGQFRTWLDTSADDITQLSPATFDVLAQGWSLTGAGNALASVGTAEFGQLNLQSLSVAAVDAMLANPATTITSDQLKTWFDAAKPDPASLSAAAIDQLYSRADMPMPPAAFWAQWLTVAAAGAVGLNQAGDLSPSVVGRIAAADLGAVLTQAPVLATRLSGSQLQAWLDSDGTDEAHRQALLDSLPPDAVNLLAANLSASGVTTQELRGWIDNWLTPTARKSLVDGQPGIVPLFASLLNTFGGALSVTAQNWADWARGTAAGSTVRNNVAELDTDLFAGMTFQQLQDIVQATPPGTDGFAAQMTAQQFNDLFALVPLSSQTIQASTLYALAAGGVDGALGGLSAAQWSQWLGASHGTAIWGPGGPDLRFLTVLALLPQPAGQPNLLSLLTGADVKAAADGNGGWNRIPFPVLNALSPATLGELQGLGFDWDAWHTPYTVDGQTVQNDYALLSAANLTNLYGSQAWPALKDAGGVYDPARFAAWAAVPGNSMSQVPAAIFNTLPALFFDALGASAIGQVSAAQWQERGLAGVSATVINAIDPAVQGTVLTGNWLTAWLGQGGQGSLVGLAPSVVAQFDAGMLDGLSPAMLATLGQAQMQAWCTAHSLADLSDGTIGDLGNSALRGIPAGAWNARYDNEGNTLELLSDKQFALVMTGAVLNGLEPGLISTVRSGQWTVWTMIGNSFSQLNAAAVKAVNDLTAADLVSWLGGNDLGGPHTTAQLLSGDTLPGNIAALINGLSSAQVDGLPAGAFDSQAWGLWLGSHGQAGFQTLSADTVSAALAVLQPRPDFPQLLTAWALQPGNSLGQLGPALVDTLTFDSPLLTNADVNGQFLSWDFLSAPNAAGKRFLAFMTADAINALPDGALAALTEEDWLAWLAVNVHQVNQLSGRVLNSLLDIDAENVKITAAFDDLVNNTLAKGWDALLSPDVAVSKQLNAAFLNGLVAATGFLPADTTIAKWVDWGQQTGNSLGQLSTGLFNFLFRTSQSLNALANTVGTGPNPLVQMTDAQWTAWLGQNPARFQNLDLAVVNTISATVLATVTVDQWTQWQGQHILAGISGLSANVLNGAASQFTITADGLQAWAAQPGNQLIALSAAVFNAMTVDEFAKLPAADLNLLVFSSLVGVDGSHWTAWGSAATPESEVGLSPDSLAAMQLTSPTTVKGLLGVWLAGSPLAGSVQGRLNLLSGAVVYGDWLQVVNALGGGDPTNALSVWAAQPDNSLADLGTAFITDGKLSPAQWQQVLHAAAPAGILASQLSDSQWVSLEKRMENQAGTGSDMFRQIFDPAVINSLDGASLAAISARWTAANAPAFTRQDLVQWQPEALARLAGTALDLLFTPTVWTAWIGAQPAGLASLAGSVINHMGAVTLAAFDSAAWQSWASQPGHAYNQLSGLTINWIIANPQLAAVKTAILSGFGPADWSDVAGNGGKGLGDLNPSVVAGFSVDTMNSLMGQAVGQLTAQQLQSWVSQQNSGWGDLGIPFIGALSNTAFASISAAGWQALAQKQGLSGLSVQAFGRISADNLTALADYAAQFQPAQLFAWMIAHPQTDGVVPGVVGPTALSALWTSYSGVLAGMNDQQKSYFQSIIGSLDDITQMQSTVQSFQTIWQALGSDDRTDLMILLSFPGTPIGAAALINTFVSLKAKYTHLTYSDLVHGLPGKTPADIGVLVDKLMASFGDSTAAPTTRADLTQFFTATPPGIARLILLDQLTAVNAPAGNPKGDPQPDPSGPNVVTLNQDETDLAFTAALQNLAGSNWTSQFQDFTSEAWKGSQIAVGLLLDPWVSMLNENVFFRSGQHLAMYGVQAAARLRAGYLGQSLNPADLPVALTEDPAAEFADDEQSGTDLEEVRNIPGPLFYIATRSFLVPISWPGYSAARVKWSNERLLLLSKVYNSIRDNMQLLRVVYSLGIFPAAIGYSFVEQNADSADPFFGAQHSIDIANSFNLASVFGVWGGTALGNTVGRAGNWGGRWSIFWEEMKKWVTSKTILTTQKNVWKLVTDNVANTKGGYLVNKSTYQTPRTNSYIDKPLYWLLDNGANLEIREGGELQNNKLAYLVKIPQFMLTVAFRITNANAYFNVLSSSKDSFSDEIRRHYAAYWGLAGASNILMGMADLVEMYPSAEGTTTRITSGVLGSFSYVFGSVGNALGAAALAKATIDKKVANGFMSPERAKTYKGLIDARLTVLFLSAGLHIAGMAAYGVAGIDNAGVLAGLATIPTFAAVVNFMLLGDWTTGTGIAQLNSYANNATNLGCGIDARFFQQLADDEWYTNVGASFFYGSVVGGSDKSFLNDELGVYSDGKSLQTGAMQRMAAVASGQTFAGDQVNTAWTAFLDSLKTFDQNFGNKFDQIQVLYACTQDFSLNKFHASVSGMYQYTYDPSQSVLAKQLVFDQDSCAFATDYPSWQEDQWAGITQSSAGSTPISKIHDNIEFTPVGTASDVQFILVGRQLPNAAGGQNDGSSVYDGWIRVDLRGVAFHSVVVDNAPQTVFLITTAQEVWGQLTIYGGASYTADNPFNTPCPYTVETSVKSLQDLAAEAAAAPAVPLLFDVVPADGGALPKTLTASSTAARGNGPGIDFYYRGDASQTPFDLDSLDLPDGTDVTFHSAAAGGEYFGTTGNKFFLSGGGDDTLALCGTGNYAQVGLGAKVALEGGGNQMMVDGDAPSGRDGAFISDGHGNSLNFSLTATDLTFDNVLGMVNIAATAADGARRQAVATGFDALWGGQGDDVFNYDHIDGQVMRDATVYGGEGDDLFNMSSCNQLDIKTGSGNNTVNLTACTDTILETSADDIGDTINVSGGSTLQAQLFGHDDVVCDGAAGNDVTLDISGGIHRISRLGDSATVSVDGTVTSTTTIVNGNGNQQGEVVGFTGVQAASIGIAYDAVNNRLEMATLDAANPRSIIADLWIDGGLDAYTDCAVFAPDPMPVAGVPTGGQAVFHFAASHLVDSLTHMSGQGLAEVTVGGRQLVLMSSLI